MNTAPDTDELLRRFESGDAAAASELLERHRDRLRRLIASRLDDRLLARVDASDVIQDTLVEAAGKLKTFAEERPLPFYPWLRRLALRRLARLRRFHLRTERRSAAREEHAGAARDRSAWQLVDLLIASETGPADQLLRAEQRDRVRAALDRLPENDRELLVLRYQERLPMAQIAAVLGVTENAAKLRHLRALKRMQASLDEGADPS